MGLSDRQMTMSNTNAFVRILERLNGTVAKVSNLRQSLVDIEAELNEIRQQCEEFHAHTAAAYMAGITPRPASSQDPDLIGPRRQQGSIDRRTRSEEKHDRSPNAGLAIKSKSKGDPTSFSPLPGASSTSRIPGRLVEPSAGHDVKTGNPVMVSRSQSTTTPDQVQVQGVAAPGSTRNHAQNLRIASQIPFRYTSRPPIHSVPFPNDLVDRSSYPPELKHEGDDWFVLFNPSSPKIKRVLEVNVVHTLIHGSGVECAKFSPDGKWLATGCWGTAQIYDVKTGVKTCILNHGNDNCVWSVSFSPDGKYLATGGGDQVRVWDIANRHIRNIFKGHQDAILSLHFSPNGRFIISGSSDGTVRIWDVHDRTLFKVLTIDGHCLSPDHTVPSVAISPDGRYVAVGSADKVAGIWEITTGVLVQTLRGHMKSVSSVVFTPDGKGLISGSWDATLKYWDISELGIGLAASAALTSASSASPSSCLMNLTGHGDGVNSTAISHDGTCVVSGSLDGNVLFWETRTGVAQCVLSGHQDTVWQVDLSPVGNFLATASSDKQVRIWSYQLVG